MSSNRGYITYACGCHYEEKLGGCAQWRHEAFARRAEVEGRKVCPECRAKINASSSIQNSNVRKIVFRMAWETARRGAEKFGGNVRSYFAAALKHAYEFARSSIAKEGFTIEVVRQTARAILARHDNGSEIWWPLSQVRIDGGKLHAPEWLVREKFAS
jgi:hypothetical protein